jgi:phage gp16-like protein
MAAAAAAKATKPARFVSPRRRSMEGKVHVAKKEMGLDEDTYRGMMMNVTGKASLTQLSDAEVEKLIEDFKTKGWQAKPKSGAAGGVAKRADHPVARKARALWISLYQLGAIENHSEQALEAFAARQLKCDRLQWTRQDHADGLIEALVAIARRNGWDPKSKSLPEVKVRLIEAILTKLKEAGYAAENWSLSEAAERIAGFETNSPSTPCSWGDSAHVAIINKFAHLLKTGRKD